MSVILRYRCDYLKLLLFAQNLVIWIVVHTKMSILNHNESVIECFISVSNNYYFTALDHFTSRWHICINDLQRISTHI